MEYVWIAAVLALLVGVALGFWAATGRWKTRLTGEQALAQQRIESLEANLEKERADGESRLAEQKLALDKAEQLRDEAERVRRASEQEGQEAKQREQAAAARLEEREQQMAELRREAEGLKETLETLRVEARTLQERLAREEEQRGATEKLIQQKQADFEDLSKRFQNEFKVLADEIFEAKDKAFRENSKKDMDALLKPLQDKLGTFHQAVQESDRRRVAESSQLKEQIKQLSELNETMRVEANSLTNALKGDSKVQGDWGEVILERLLERSGLVRGREYTVQNAQRTEEGRQLRPDVVLHLPDEKNLVIDAKVSLKAYEQYASADEGPKRDAHAKAHLESLRQHVRGLSGKNYTQLYGLDGVDFVLLFIPIEPAFSLALRQQEDFFLEAFRLNVVLVTPSTLLATLRTIAQVWRQEKQHKNVALIADEAGKLHEKFVGLLTDLDKLGAQFGTAQKTYDKAMGKLSTGRGNLIGKVENLKTLGAKTKKHIPEAFKDALEIADPVDADLLEDGAGDDGKVNPPQAEASNADAHRDQAGVADTPSGEGLFGQ